MRNQKQKQTVHSVKVICDVRMTMENGKWLQTGRRDKERNVRRYKNWIKPLRQGQIGLARFRMACCAWHGNKPATLRTEKKRLLACCTHNVLFLSTYAAWFTLLKTNTIFVIQLIWDVMLYHSVRASQHSNIILPVIQHHIREPNPQQHCCQPQTVHVRAPYHTPVIF